MNADSLPGSVALLLHGLDGSGAQRRTLQLAGALAGLGEDVDLVVVDPSGALAPSVPAGVRLVALDAPLRRAPWIRGKRRRQVAAAIPALARFLRRRRPAVLVAAANHVHFAAILAHAAAGRRDIALVLRVSNALFAGRGGASVRMRRAAARLLYGRADAVSANSPALAEEVRRLVPSMAERVRFVPAPVVNDALFRSAHREPGFPWPSDPVVLTAARLAPQKDLPTLIRAFALLRKSRPAHLVILGEGPERPALQRLVAELGLADAVSLPGFVDAPAAAMRRADVVALSSLWEGTPGTLIEAMALGRPVVSTDIPGSRALLDGGRLGRLTPVGDPAAMAAALSAAMDGAPDPEALRRGVEPFNVAGAVRGFQALLAGAARRRAERNRRPATSPPARAGAVT